ncbi:ABC transporter permease [Variovorax sp. PBL-E5]|uniref:ABC transporter permease n=1 Tax=Variovorax sp. PBL-E5 TaxID=434014 RepID=UPI00131734C7|nr:ABC transporter permease [Variovorax sp. PBL-E5]VTU34446.1 Putative aliphatic sulfonates transport permease protein SsuC [Variovorax sp. PBL-E5]
MASHHLADLARERSKAKRRRSTAIWLIRFGALAGTLVLWQAVADLKIVDSALLSRPTDVADYMVQNFGTILAKNASVTLLSALAGFVLGSLAATIVGFLLVRSPLLETALDPFLTLLNAFPRIALAPLFVAWLGIGAVSNIVTAITVIFFIVLINVIAGAKSVDRDLGLLMTSLGASSAVRFRRLVLPWAVPSIFAGLKLALIYAMLAVIVSEMMAGSKGLGGQVSYLSNTFHMDGVFAVLIFVAILTTLLTTAMNWLERRLLRWQAA